MSALTLQERARHAQPVEKQLAPHLRCSSCGRPMFNAYQTPHGCRLCEPCVREKLPQQDLVLCPGTTEECKNEAEEIRINQASCFTDIATRREIAKTQVLCPNRAAGCDEKMKWREVDAHLAGCSFEKLPCELCGKEFLKNELKDHVRKSCPKRRVSCDLCGAKIVFSAMKTEHKNLQSQSCCEHFKAKCPFACGSAQEFNRSTFLVHLATCTKRPTECKFRHLGCSVMLPVCELPAHYSAATDVHLTMMEAKLSEVSRATPPAASATMDADACQPSDAEVKQLTRKVMNIYHVFKKLQLSSGDWAQTTVAFDEMLKGFGGIGGFQNLLRRLDERGRLAGGDAGNRRPDASFPGDELSRLQERIAAIELRLQSLMLASYEGFLAWKLSGVADKRREASAGRSQYLYSPPFFHRRYGHMLRARLSMSGAHLSVSLVLVQSEYDDILEWPFVADVAFRLVNLRSRGDDATAKADIDSGARRPADRDDLSVGSGEKKLAKLSELEKFVKNDCLYVEVEVEQRTSGGPLSRKGRKR